MRYLISVMAFVALAWSVGAGAEETRVYVAPVSESGSIIRPGWLSERFTKNLNDALKPIKSVSLIKGRSAESDALVLENARAAHAHLAIVASVRVLADQIEARGQLLDVLSGNSLGTMKADGAPRDIFSVEESFARQTREMVQGLVAPQPRPAPVATPTAPSTPPASNEGSRYTGSSLQQSLFGRENEYPQQVDREYTAPVTFGGYYDPYTYVPTYSPYWNNGWGWGNGGPNVVVIQQTINNNGTGTGSGGTGTGGGGATGTVPPTTPVVTTASRGLPGEVRTRGDAGSLVATPLPNTIVDPRAPGVQMTINSVPANSILHVPANSVLMPSGGSGRATVVNTTPQVQTARPAAGGGRHR